MKLGHTRQMLSEALEGNLDNATFDIDPVFGLAIPTEVDDIPTEILTPRNTWSDKEAYDQKADELASMFAENFQQFEDEASEELIKAGPKVEV